MSIWPICALIAPLSQRRFSWHGSVKMIEEGSASAGMKHFYILSH